MKEPKWFLKRNSSKFVFKKYPGCWSLQNKKLALLKALESFPLRLIIPKYVTKMLVADLKVTTAFETAPSSCQTLQISCLKQKLCLSTVNLCSVVSQTLSNKIMYFTKFPHDSFLRNSWLANGRLHKEKIGPSLTADVVIKNYVL